VGHGILVFSFIVVAIIFTWQLWKRQLPYITFGVLVAALSQIFLLLSNIAYYMKQPSGVYWALLHHFTLSICAFLFYLYFEASYTVRPPYWRFSGIFGLTCLSFGIFIESFSGILSPQTALLLLIPTHASAFSLTLMFGIIVTFKIHQLGRERTQFIQLITLIPVLLSGILLFLGGLLAIFNILDLYELHIVVPILLLPAGTGVLILVVNYLVNPDFISRIPHPIHHVMLYNEGGLAVYSRWVHTPTISTLSIDAAIVSGLFTAISSIIRETLGKEAQLGYIDASKYQIFFAQVPDNTSTLAIISSHGTGFLQRSIKNFVKLFPRELVHQINDSTVAITKFGDELDSLILQAFPYLVIQKENPSI